MPAAAGTAVPRFASLVATVGDEQDLLADRSTFSGRLLRLTEAWERAGPSSLALLDELGSGTDPEEGAALAVALLEALVERGGLALITTHLTGLAAAALELPGAACAAMEFDPATGRPTFRLLPGPPGGSEAIALARRLGLARELDRTRRGAARPGSTATSGACSPSSRRRASELAAAPRRAAPRREDAGRATSGRDWSARVPTLEAERRTIAARSKRELEAFREQVRAELAGEVERLQGRARRRAPAESRRGSDGAALRGGAAVAAPSRGGERRAAGGRRAECAIARSAGRGRLEKLDGDRAEVRVAGKRLRSAAEELISVGTAAPPAAPGKAAATPAVRPSPRMPEAPEVAAELHLIGQRVEPALDALDGYLDQALRAGRAEVRVVHGHGTGRLRDAVREHLASHPAVAASRPGDPNEGGNGATVVRLRG